ncbi:phospholipase A2 inhibitor and Ly6/PLAUR domain-containing protein-like [Periophthalmus magnuspinnatus]|uniref:phospholipase A2 inhibitor and Ly6/PLAUR domain-containing protein-like n=1 Tax=Periophthalmus magnuspinnatus TaxID=409849 RepID=UPI0024371A7C|nr:phospholipase A2 inhibitor and Ly6/PLAUR domain-containing protein-like [Periophthalmus magnuspinnatus]
MHLFFLVSGIALFPQAYTLTCNKCRTGGATCGGSEEQCPAEFTRCTAMRLFMFQGNIKRYDEMYGSCAKPEHCTDASFNGGVLENFITTKCCDSDKCNTEKPPEPIRKTNPNGLKCYRCDGKSDCTGTLNCDGDQIYCASGEGEHGIIKGCATKSMCVDPSPLIKTVRPLKCCDKNYCNGGTSTSASLLLLTTTLLSLFFFSN